MVYKRQNILLMIYTSNRYICFFSILFCGISLILRNIIPFKIALMFISMQIISCIIAFSIGGITNEININDKDIIIKKDCKKIFYKKEYDLIIFKSRGLEGLLLKENKKECKIWKYEFIKKDWTQIKEILMKNSKTMKNEDDLSGWKYDGL